MPPRESFISAEAFKNRISFIMGQFHFYICDENEKTILNPFAMKEAWISRYSHTVKYSPVLIIHVMSMRKGRYPEMTTPFSYSLLQEAPANPKAS